MSSLAGVSTGAAAVPPRPSPSKEDAAVCDQCGLPLGRRPVTAQLEIGLHSFCCNGCLWVAKLVGTPGERAVARGLVLRLGLALFFALNGMVFSLAHYGNLLGGSAEGESAERFFDVQRWAQLALAVPVLILLGGPTLARLPDVLRGRPAGLDGLVGVGAAAAFTLSVVNTIRGQGPIYFDTAVMLLVLVTLGKALEATARAKAVDAWTRLESDEAESFTVVREGLELELTADAILEGDRVEIPPGAEIPVDGEILQGRALVSTAWLTGEAVPKDLGAGDSILAGAHPVDGSLIVSALAVGRDRRRERLRDLLDDARRRRPALVCLADRMATALLPITLAVAALAFLLGWMAGGPVEASSRAIATLVVACPCALGIAAPLAYWSAWSAPARSGVWLAGADVVERLAGVRSVVFDKTGTLTETAPELSGIELAAGATVSEEEALALAAGLERGVPHPLAAAVRRACPEPTAVDERRVVPGLGVRGRHQGRELLLGSARFLKAEGVEPLAARPDESTALHLAIDGRPVALLLLGEELRFGAGPARRGLDSLGVDVVILSGDDEARTRAIADALGVVRAHGELLPEDKLERIERWSTELPLAMAGDGMNDAPALAAATVGIALGDSADLTRAAADVAAPGASPAVVPALIRHARFARRVVQQNFIWAATYNAVGLSLAAAGMLHPIVAASLMLASSLIVVTNSQRVRRFPALPVALEASER